MLLFEVKVKSRVVIKTASKIKRLRGMRGKWYFEILYYFADSERKARESVIDDISNRRILGVSIRRRGKLKREIKILNVRRLA